MALFGQIDPDVMPLEGSMLPWAWAGLILVVAFILRAIALTFLRRKNFDELFHVPWKPLRHSAVRTRWRASRVLGWAIILTGTYLAIVQLQAVPAFPFQFSPLAGQIVSQGWMLLGTALVALALSRFVAQIVLSVFENHAVRAQLELLCPQSEMKALNQTAETPVADKAGTVTETDATNNPMAVDRETLRHLSERDSNPPIAQNSPVNHDVTRESFADTVARIVGLVIYLIVCLPVFMVAAEIWNWTTAGEAISQIWQWLLPFAGLTAVIMVGWFVITAAAVSICPPEQRRVVLIATTILAVILLAATFNTAFAIVISVMLVLLVWITRKDLGDVVSGIYLRMQSEVKVTTNEGQGKIERQDLLTANVKTVQGLYRIRNRPLLKSYLDGTMIDPARMIAIDPHPRSESMETEPDYLEGMKKISENE